MIFDVLVGDVIVTSLRILSIFKPGQRPARTWFLEIAFVWEVSMHVCLFIVCLCARPQAIKNHSREVELE